MACPRRGAEAKASGSSSHHPPSFQGEGRLRPLPFQEAAAPPDAGLPAEERGAAEVESSA